MKGNKSIFPRSMLLINTDFVLDFVILFQKPDRPFAVSLVRKKCNQAVNKLQVIFKPPISGKKMDFAVCVKGLDFPQQDISFRLMEWIELLKILGAHKIFFYEYSVHPNAKKVTILIK